MNNKMNSISDASDSKLLEAHTHIWKHTFNFITSMSLKCAIELNIPDVIHSHGQPMTLSKLVSAPSINPKKIDCVYRLMRLLVHAGFFAQENVCLSTSDSKKEGYVLTTTSYLLLKDNPLSVSPWSLMILDPICMKPWEIMSTWFQNDDATSCYTTHKKMYWEISRDEPRFNKLFNEAMASDSLFVAGTLIKKYKRLFEGLKSIVNVGGGTGTLTKAIASEFPDMDYVVHDLPHVVADLEDKNNLKYIGGDMFLAVPSANAVLLKWILHNWNDEECVQILKNCKESITNFKSHGGKVIIIDIVMGNKKDKHERPFEVQLLMNLEMMVLLNGKERNEKEWAKLFTNAGFHHYNIYYSTLGESSIIEVYP
ncbi:hypothetical protein ACFE04_018965 [Oxalis oulophora]